MQQTRQHILEILKEREQATVDEIVQDLSQRIGEITAVTVRHHLEILRGDGLVAAPIVRRRTTPGRPQHVYSLTDRALELFPNNYRQFAQQLLLQIKSQLPRQEVNVILENVAERMASDVIPPDVPMPARLERVVEYLTSQGYQAAWETTEQGYILRTNNCPYHHLAADHEELCAMDMRLISTLLGGIVPRRVEHLPSGGLSCTYLIPARISHPVPE
ncbi:MAG: ArsR family transcriptional regulator [Anaerolineae bacterium]|nr:ArsR family transcriptional regulator [Anaerolineae bacterium]